MKCELPQNKLPSDVDRTWSNTTLEVPFDHPLMAYVYDNKNCREPLT